MFSNRLALAALGVACVAAAGAGSFLASRQSVPAVQVSAASAPESVAVPVTETEGILGDVGSKDALPPSGHGVQAEAPEELHNAAPVAAARTPARPQPAPKAQTQTAPSPAPAPQVPQQARVNTPPPAPVPAPQAPPAPVAPPPAPAPAVDPGFIGAREPEPREPEVIRAPEPPVRQEKELVVSAGSVIGLQLDSTVTTERAKVEDRVDARVSRDVRVGNDVVIPSGARAIGTVVTVERGGRVKDPARLGVRFHTLILADGTRLPITTETIYRIGESPTNGTAAKVGGAAVGGAILGAIIGGAKGAAIGGAVGAGAGTTAVMTGDRKAAELLSGSQVNAKVLYPVNVTIEK